VRALFITGTDTGVGKTTIALSLASYLSLKERIDVGVMKPFETGLTEGSVDSTLLKQVSGSPDDISIISPYRFELPLSPYAASVKEGREIDLEFLDGVFEKLMGSHRITLVEGAGGVLAPIRRGLFFADLIKRWDLPTLLVAPLGLGTINHTLLTLRYLSSVNIEVVGVVLNDRDAQRDPSKESNPRIIAEHTNVTILGIFPYLQQMPERERLAEIAQQCLDLRPILSRIPWPP
jgi:dethiobiotin synthetase